MTTVTKVLTIAIVSLGLLSCSQQGAPSRENIAEAESTLRAEASLDVEQETMIRVLGLNATEAHRLSQAFDTRYKLLEQFLAGEKGQQLIALEAELRAAATEKDLVAVKEVIDRATPIREGFRQLIEDQNQALLDTLTPDQATHWQGYKVAMRLLESMGPLNLTAEQMVTISEAGPSTFFQAQQGGEVNPKAAAFMTMEGWAESDVLSPAQREAYQAIKDKKGLRSLGI